MYKHFSKIQKIHNKYLFLLLLQYTQLEPTIKFRPNFLDSSVQKKLKLGY